MLGKAVDQEDRGDHDQDEADHQPGEFVDAAIEGGGNALAGDLVGKLAEEGCRPGPHDHAGAVAGHDVGAHEAEVRHIEGLFGGGGAWLGMLLGGHRFAGQGGLIDEQILGFEQAQIGGDHVARRKPHHVARDQTIHRNLDERVIGWTGAAPDAGRGVDHGAQLGCRLIRPVFLDEGRRDRQHDHGGDHHRGADVSQEIGDDRQRQQQGIQGIASAAPQFFGNAGLAFARDEIGAELLQPHGGFGAGQALRSGLQFRAGFRRLKAGDRGKQPVMGWRGRTDVSGLLGRRREYGHECHLGFFVGGSVTAGRNHHGQLAGRRCERSKPGAPSSSALLRYANSR